MRPLPQAPESANGMPGVLENGEPGQRLRTSLSEKIPDHNALSMYEDLDSTQRLRNDRELSPHTTPRPSQRHGGYEEVPEVLFSSEPAVRQKPSPPSKKRGGYEEVPDGSFATNEPEVRRKPSHFPPKRLSPPVEAMYAQVDKSAKTNSRPNSVNGMIDLPNEPYGQLNHFSPTSQQLPLGQDYGKLAHTNKPPSTQATYPTGQEYARLDTCSVTAPVPSFQPGEYGHLQHSPSTGVSGYQPEEYGRLDYGGPPAQAAVATNGYHPEEYGRLDRSREPSPISKTTTPSEEYGRLGSAFDPYGTLAGDEIESMAQNTGKSTIPHDRYEMVEYDDSPTDTAIYSEIDEGVKVSPKKGLHCPSPWIREHSVESVSSRKSKFHSLFISR